MIIRFQPLVSWPGAKTTSRRTAPFHAGYDSTVRLLEYELKCLKASNVVILADCEERDIRRDGLLRGDARPRTPRVVVTFDCKHGSLSYPCDTFYDWRDNLRAIAKALENLRAVDRWGVTMRGEQYTGWAQLPAPQAPTGFSNADAAAEWLAYESGAHGGQEISARFILTDRSCFDATYRAVAKRLHPDTPGGSTEAFQRLQQAKEIIEKVLPA